LKYAPQPEIAKHSLKPHIFGVQGRLRSSMLVPPESSSPVLVMISSKSVSSCNRSHSYRRVGLKYRFFGGDAPLWRPRSSGISLSSATTFGHKNSTLSYGDRITIASMRLELTIHAVARKKSNEGTCEATNDTTRHCPV